MKNRWETYNLIWLLIFSLALAWMFGMSMISLIFIILIFFFVWIFLRSLSKFEAVWVAWIIPYFLLVIFVLWLFERGNIFFFFLKGFWLSLRGWFSYPVLPEGRALIFVIITYFVSYLLAKNIKKISNTSIALGIIAVIIGIIAQFMNQYASFLMFILFIFSLIFNAKYHEKSFSRSIFFFISILFTVVTIAFLAGILFRPISPLSQIVSSISNQIPTATQINHQIMAKKTIKVIVSRPSTGSTIPNKSPKVPEWIYNIFIDLTGTVVIAFGIVGVVLTIKHRKKGKKRHFKKLLIAIWLIVSAFFIVASLLYAFTKIGVPVEKLETFAPHISQSASNNVSVIASIVSAPTKKVFPSLFSNSIFWIALAMMAISFFIFIIFELLRYDLPGQAGSKNAGQEEQFNFNPASYEFSGSPEETVLFYYRLLRSKIGNPSFTPYEFKNEIEKLIGQDEADKLTKIFVKLRYAKRRISQDEANFVKEKVLTILKV